MNFKIGKYKLEQRTIEPTSFYVYFDPAKLKIEKITNLPAENYEEISFFLTTHDVVKNFLDGTRKIEDAKISFNPELKEFEIVKLNQKELTVHDYIYELLECEDADISLILDYSNTCWKILLSERFMISLSLNNVIIDSLLQFSVTEKGNPNILHKMIKVPFDHLGSNNYYIIPFDSQFELDKTPVSIYTMKKFNSYSFEVIDE